MLIIMTDIFIYLLKVSSGIGIVFLTYIIFLRNDSNLILKRFYLLMGLALAWILPRLVFHRPDFINYLSPAYLIDPGGPIADTAVPSIASTAEASPVINWTLVLLILYMTGSLLILTRNIWFFLKIRRDTLEQQDGSAVVYTGSNHVFAFFRKIFIPESLRQSEDTKNIILHEQAHVRQFHFIDLIIMESTLMLTWFNPFSWLISRMIKENHEHLADRSVLQSGVNVARYRAQLLNHTMGVSLFGLGNQFNHSLTLKRFKMMKKTESSRKGAIRYVLLIPAVIFVMGFSTGMTPQIKPVKGTIVFAGEKEPAPGAAIIIKGTTMGTVADIDGSFTLNADKNDILVISFVGYATREIKVSDITDKPIPLTMMIYNLDLDKVPEVLPEERSTGSNSAKAPAGEGRSTGEKKVLPDNNQEVFYIVEDIPSFPGGKPALKSHIYSRLKYPEKARKAGLEGKVDVMVTIPASGIPRDFTVVHSTDKIFDEAALKALEDMPAWNPGRQRGKPVRTRVMIPVRFSLNGD